jgi:thymidylate synthase ThyX
VLAASERLTLDFHTEEFTDEERVVLSRFFTNLDSPVFAITNLPEVVKGALFARYSRSFKSVRRLFLDEFYNEPEVGMRNIAEAIESDDPMVKLQRAQALYDRVFSEYGDDSVAQLGGAHLACEQASNVLTKVLEWGRLASYLEQSTRYIFYDKKLGERYRYAIPPEITRSRHHNRYVETMDWLFDTYAGLVHRLVPYYEALFPKQEGDSNFVWRSTIRAKACDDIRGLLPAATRSSVGIFASGQAYEMMLIKMRAHPLAEVREYADLMLTELRKVIPSFMRRVDVPDRGGAWTGYLAGIATEMNEMAARIETSPEPRPEVALVEWDENAELKIAAAALYPYTDLPDDQILDLVSRMSGSERSRLLRAYVGERTNRRHKPGRGLERCDYRFDILCDYGIFRDLQRHRMLSVDWQRLSPTHGYITPEAIEDISATGVWDEAMTRTKALYDEINADIGPDVAQYVIPFAYRIRFYFQMNVREAFHLLELRTGPGGHPGYRRVAQEMHRLIAEQAGHKQLAEAMSYVDHNDYDLARLEGERRSAAKRAALGLDEPE